MTEFRNRRRRRDQAGWLLEDPRLLHCHHNPRRFIVKGQESHTLEMLAIAFFPMHGSHTVLHWARQTGSMGGK
jgi:hypothetical protein